MEMSVVLSEEMDAWLDESELNELEATNTNEGGGLAQNALKKLPTDAEDGDELGLELRHFASSLQSKTMDTAAIERLVGLTRGDGDDRHGQDSTAHAAAEEQQKQRVRQANVHIGPYMNPDPLSVQPSASVERCYRLFRGVGLRHLCVVDGNLTPVGVITRKDLMSAFTQDLC